MGRLLCRRSCCCLASLVDGADSPAAGATRQTRSATHRRMRRFGSWFGNFEEVSSSQSLREQRASTGPKPTAPHVGLAPGPCHRLHALGTLIQHRRARQLQPTTRHPRPRASRSSVHTIQYVRRTMDGWISPLQAKASASRLREPRRVPEPNPRGVWHVTGADL